MGRYFPRRRKGRRLPEFAESGVSAGSRSHPRAGPLRLFGEVSLGGILDVPAQRAGRERRGFRQANPLRRPHHRERPAGAQLPIGAHRQNSGFRTMGRMTADGVVAGILHEQRAGRD